MKRFLSILTASTVVLAGYAFAQDEEGGMLDEGAAPAETVKPEKVKREHGQAEKKERAPKVQPVLEDITVSGTVAKEEKAGAEGKPSRVSYSLTTEDGTVVAFQVKPARKPKGEGAEAVAAPDISTYVGQKVTVVGKGMRRTLRDKQSITISQIATITAE